MVKFRFLFWLILAFTYLCLAIVSYNAYREVKEVGGVYMGKKNKKVVIGKILPKEAAYVDLGEFLKKNSHNKYCKVHVSKYCSYFFRNILEQLL